MSPLRAFITATIVMLVIFFFLSHARAEWIVVGNLSQARFEPPGPDGNWTQELLPSRNGIPGVAQTRQSMTWDVGAGYRFAGGESPLSTLWSIEAGYRDYGSGISAGGLGVSDEKYGAIMEGTLNPRSVRSSQWEATDHMRGGFVRALKGMELGYGFELVATGGFELLYHDLVGNTKGQAKAYGYTGIMGGPTVGGGLRYHIGRGVKARVMVEQHWMMLETEHPITSAWTLVGGGIEVPLGF